MEILRRLEQSRCLIGIIGTMTPTFGGQDPLQENLNLNQDHPGIFRIRTHNNPIREGRENDTSPWISTILKTHLLTVVRQEGLGLQVRPACPVYLSLFWVVHRWLQKFLKKSHQFCLIIRHSLAWSLVLTLKSYSMMSFISLPLIFKVQWCLCLHSNSWSWSCPVLQDFCSHQDFFAIFD